MTLRTTLGCAVIASAVLAACSARTVRADSFSWQIGAGVSRYGAAPQIDFDTTTVEATRYFRPVDDANGAYALAPFLNPTTSVTASIGTDESSPGEANDWAIGGRYVWSSTHWYIGGAYARSIPDERSPLPGLRYGDRKTGRVVGGRYFGSRTTLELSRSSSASENGNEAFRCLRPSSCYFSPLVVSRIESADTSVSALHVGRAGTMDYVIGGGITRNSIERTVRGSLEPGISPGLPLPPFIPTEPVAGSYRIANVTPELSRYAVMGELFPIENVGVRLDYARSDGETPDDYRYDITTTWFVTHRVAVRFSIGHSELRFDGYGADNTALGVTARL